jgi:arginine decarboxylase
MTSIFVEVRRMGAPIQYLDVGGGLAVDYDGSHTNFQSSANYGLQEYAADVVNAVSVACAEAGVPHPAIVTEAGRALVAHHSLLVVESFATSQLGEETDLPIVPKKGPEVLLRMKEIYANLSGKNFQECYHDAMEARREALMLFNLRHLSLEDRARVETFFWIICRKILRYMQQLDYNPDELEGLEQLLSTNYYCNFSIFQSLPDHWAIKQLFPVAPLHRLDERPEVQGILADITCDSDGVVDRFVDLRDVKDTIYLHPLRAGEPYYIGIFLVGAYQEILGDLHNLFGDTTVVHVSSGPNGYIIDKTLRGDTNMDVLNYVQFIRPEFVARVRAKVEEALMANRITFEQSAAFMRTIEQGLDMGTYLAGGP